MRDLIKEREYFDLFILEDTNRVLKFKEKLLAGEVREDRILPVKRMIVQVKIGIIIAKYSRGDSLENIKSDFEEIVDLFEEAWDSSSYEDNLRFVSLAYLFDLSEESKKKIANKLYQSDTYDWLIDSFLNETFSSLDINNLSFPESYELLVEAMKSSNIDSVKEYLNGWYEDHYHSSWYDTHKSTKVNTYYGYWCFEAAVVMRMLNLDDNSLVNEKYYPYDMAHYKK